MSTLFFKRQRARPRSRRSTRAQVATRWLKAVKRGASRAKQRGWAYLPCSLRPSSVKRRRFSRSEKRRRTAFTLAACALTMDADQGVPLPGLYLLVVEEFAGRMR